MPLNKPIQTNWKVSAGNLNTNHSVSAKADS